MAGTRCRARRAARPGTEAPSPVGVANIDYDAKGQRQRIDYENGASTIYDYDPLTFRLTQLLTRRNAVDLPRRRPAAAASPAGRASQVQNLHYTYDPAGNITHIRTTRSRPSTSATSASSRATTTPTTPSTG